MASVYVSRDPVLGRKVAVTVLSDELAANLHSASASCASPWQPLPSTTPTSSPSTCGESEGRLRIATLLCGGTGHGGAAPTGSTPAPGAPGDRALGGPRPGPCTSARGSAPRREAAGHAAQPKQMRAVTASIDFGITKQLVAATMMAPGQVVRRWSTWPPEQIAGGMVDATYRRLRAGVRALRVPDRRGAVLGGYAGAGDVRLHGHCPTSAARCGRSTSSSR